MAFASFDPKSASAPMAEINMVPLIDVMLVLLVIFIVTAPLLTHAVKLELPRASSQVNQLKPDKIEFAIDAQGQRFWNGEPLSRARRPSASRPPARRQPQPEMHLRADQAVAYRAVAETLADASRAGLTRIGFVSEPERPLSHPAQA
jgi:biopolymer transport protein ExbD